MRLVVPNSWSDLENKKQVLREREREREMDREIGKRI
jgi:hypothetical protein